MIDPALVFDALRKSLSLYADEYVSDELATVAFEMERFSDGTSHDPALWWLFAKMTTQGIKSLPFAFQVAEEFVESELYRLRKITTAERVIRDLGLARAEPLSTLPKPLEHWKLLDA